MARDVEVSEEDVYAIRLALFTAQQKYLRSARSSSLAGDERRRYRKLAEAVTRVLDQVENPRKRAKVTLAVVRSVTRHT